MSDDLTRRIEAIIRDGLWFEIKGDNPATAIGQIACAIASLIAEREDTARREGIAEGEGRLRICLTCGKTVDAEKVKRGDDLGECMMADGIAACLFDMTPIEAAEYWRGKWHRERPAEIAAARAEGRKDGLEEARFYAAQRIGFLECALGELDTEDDALEADDIDQQLFEARHIERHLRSIAAKEATNGQ